MIILIPSQMPQQDIGMIAQALMGQGFVQQPASERSRDSHAIIFYTSNKSDVVTMKFYQDIGTLRVETQGEVANKICVMLQQYFEGLTPPAIEDLFEKAQTDMEKRVYAILLVLAYENAETALRALHEKYIKNGNDATREGIVQGFAFLETPDVGTALESIEAEFQGQPIAAMCRKGIDALSARGLIRESLGSFENKIRALIDTDPSAALEQIETYCKDNPDAPALRALKARALSALGRAEDALAILAEINVDDLDAPEAFCERAKLREAQKFIDHALRDIQCALACEPTNEEALAIFRRLSMVACSREASDEDKLVEYTHALEDNPDDVNILCQRAECLLRLREFEKARNDALHARKLSPNDQRIPQLLCEAFLGMNFFGSALEQASLAQKVFLPSQRVDSLLLRARVLMAMNRFADARTAVRELPADVQDSPEVRLFSGLTAELCGHDDEARHAYAELDSDTIRQILARHPLTLSVDARNLRSIAQTALPAVQPNTGSELGNEPTDPYFKRCRNCGTLTMGRRTYCKECGGSDFFA